jgi:hypothetical protein
MTSVPFITLIVIASVQAPSSTPAPPDDATSARATISNETLPETAVGARPFQKLFTQSNDALNQAERARRLLEAQTQIADRNAPKTVCGMIVIPADPQIDPKMVHRPLVPSTTFHIKRVPPTTCAE